MSPKVLAKRVVSSLIWTPWAARRGPIVLTYHACFRNLPPGVAEADNVTPDALYEQIDILKNWFTFIPLHELITESPARGVAAITFDDGYKSVIEEGLPVLEALNVPATIFLNSSSFEGKVFWRHKLVYLLQTGSLGELDRSARDAQELYLRSKTGTFRSQELEARMDGLLSSRGLTLENYLFDDDSFLRQHPLLSYGNHTHRHLVLASLRRDEQFEEISRTDQFLKKKHWVHKSSVLSVPFGEAHHVNADTFHISQELGYSAVAMNRGGTNRWAMHGSTGVPIVERFSPSCGSIEWQVKRQVLRGPRAAVADYKNGN